MNRERKYRAWDGEKMHYNVAPWQWDFVISLAWHKCERSTGKGILGSGGKEGDFLVPGIRYEKLMDWTGLKDKNGKEIYEGDICNGRYGRFKVFFSDGGFHPLCGDINAENDPRLIEVIGNIYETPELLTSKSTSI